jgi:hypothetical protein
MADTSAETAMRQGMADARARQDYYQARPGQGVPAGTTGADPQPLTLPEDATTGAHAVPGTQGGAR